ERKQSNNPGGAHDESTRMATMMLLGTGGSVENTPKVIKRWNALNDITDEINNRPLTRVASRSTVRRTQTDMQTINQLHAFDQLSGMGKWVWAHDGTTKVGMKYQANTACFSLPQPPRDASEEMEDEEDRENVPPQT